MRLFLVTGGAGFVGSHIARYLVERNQQVRIVDDFTSGSMENIADIADKVDIRNIDIRDMDSVQEAVAGVDYIFHQAAITSVDKSFEDPFTTNCVNINGTLNLMLAARDRGVKRVILASSSAVYGLHPILPQAEHNMKAPASPYAITKCAVEQFAAIFTERYGLDTVCLRYFNIFGPGQDFDSPYTGVISKFIDRLASGKQPIIYGDGNQTRDFIYIDNVVEANILACFSEDAVGQVINIGTGNNLSINKLAKKIAERLETPLNPIYTQKREHEIYHSLADTKRARQVLDFIPRVTFIDGLSRTIQWYLNEKETEGISKQEIVDV